MTFDENSYRFETDEFLDIVFLAWHGSTVCVLTRVLMRCETRQKKPISKLSLGLKHTHAVKHMSNESVIKF